MELARDSPANNSRFLRNGARSTDRTGEANLIYGCLLVARLALANICTNDHDFWLIVILESSYRIIKKRDKEICDLKSPRIKLSFNENDERTVCPLDGTKKYWTIRVENTCVTLIENCLLEISYNCRGPHTVLRPFDIRPLGIETCCFIASYTIHEYVTVESVLLSGNRWVDIPGGYILSKDNYLFKITASANNSPPAVIKLRIHRSNGHLTMKNKSLTD